MENLGESLDIGVPHDGIVVAGKVMGRNTSESQGRPLSCRASHGPVAPGVGPEKHDRTIEKQGLIRV